MKGDKFLAFNVDGTQYYINVDQISSITSISSKPDSNSRIVLKEIKDGENREISVYTSPNQIKKDIEAIAARENS